MSWEQFEKSVQRAAQSGPKPKSKLGAIGGIAILASLAGIIIAATVVPVATFAAFTTRDLSQEIVDLPLQLDEISNPQTSQILASNGELIAYFYDENRQDVPLEEIAPIMQEAIIAIEDTRFYEHGALDLRGTTRAFLNNAADGQTQGGSSITQQLVKLALVQQATTPEQRAAATEVTTARKIRELKLAINHEKKYSKDEILEQYLNIAYFGDGAYGVNAAAAHFFSTTPEELTLAQAATLAGLVQHPEEYNPRVYPERATQRRNTVLAVMANQGKIERAEAEEQIATPLGLNIQEFPNGCVASEAAFSCDYIRRYLLQDESLGGTYEDREAMLRRDGIVVRSNIDIRMQRATNNSVRNHVDATDQAIGSLAMVEPGTGKVRAISQSRPMGTERSAGETFLNFSAPRQYSESMGFQAGSTFKMFTVAAALRKNMPVSTRYNSPQTMTMPRGTYYDCRGGGTDEWRVSNSTSSGMMDMYTGTRLSVNTYFAQLEAAVGLCDTVKAAEDMGINVPFPEEGETTGANNQVPSFTLGVTSVSTVDMAAAYAVPASGGMYCEPYPIDEITDRDGNVIKTYEPQCERVLTDGQAAQINDILRGVQEPGGFGYGRGTGLPVASAAKTGTTQNTEAVWYAGYTPELSTAAMIAGANQEGQPQALRGVVVKGRVVAYEASGSALSGPMWADAMRPVVQYLPPTPFAQPPQGRPVYAPPPAPSSSNNSGDDNNDGDNDSGDDSDDD